MSNQDNSDALLDALRRVGVVIPDLPPIEVRTQAKPLTVLPTLHVEQPYWHVIAGAFDTMIDYRDASNEQDALAVALSALQPWYVRLVNGQFAVETPLVKRALRREYLEWIQRGVR